MTLYAIHAQVITRNGAYEGSRQVPTFYLDSRVQGITDQDMAARIAANVLNPLGAIPDADLRVSAYPVDAERDGAGLDQADGVPLTWERAHALLSVAYSLGEAHARDALLRAERHGSTLESFPGYSVRVRWSGEAGNTFTVTSESTAQCEARDLESVTAHYAR